MGVRDAAVSSSILRAIFQDARDDNRKLLSRILAFFALFQTALSRYDADLFHELRTIVWEMDEENYRQSFQRGEEKARLQPVGDLGYSGSTFFTTPDSRFLVKSLPRPSEYQFFKKDLLHPYADHVKSNPESLLVRITDFLHTRSISIGSILSLAPSHHIIMENILYGEETDSRGDDWKTWDLKPIDYFYPERDLAGGMLASKDVIDRLVDKFEDKIRVSQQEKDDLLAVLDSDTRLLQSCNVVDYSLFLVRYPSPSPFGDVTDAEGNSQSTSRNVKMHAARSSAWRNGVESADKKWVYRATVLDFFWAKHATQAKLMTGLIKSFNMFAKKGPMSITADAKEYQQRFMGMVEGFLEVTATAA